jgi:hypothetical protein
MTVTRRNRVVRGLLGAVGVVVAALTWTAGGLAAVPSPPAGVVLEDYEVQSGDTCAKIARELFGDSRRVVDIHTYNDLGATPHHLKPGMVLRLPRAKTSSEPDARITFVRNQVEAYKPEPKPATINETLFRGHKVGTKIRASAELLFADTSRIQLGEQSLIVILEGRASGARAAFGAETTLVTGALRSRLDELAGSEPAKPTVVRTEAAELNLGPGEAQVQVDEKKTTRLAVYRGRSHARAKRKTVEVPEGFGNRTDAGQPPGEPKPLPPAPTWIAAPPVELSVVDTGALHAKYGPGPGAGPAAEIWHVQIAQDESFNDLVVDARVPATVTDLEAKNLAPGAYLIRVSAIDAEAFEGAWSSVATTKVLLAPPPPPAPPPVPPPPPPSPAPAPPPPARPTLVPGGALLGGLSLAARSEGWIGSLAGLELDLARRPAHDALVIPALGLRAVYEHLGASADTAAPVSRRDALDLSLFVSARFGRSTSRLRAFVGVGPQVVVARVGEPSGRAFQHTWLGAVGLAGAEIRLGPGAVLVELDGRYPVRRPSMSEDAQLGFLHLLAGYRLGL